MAIDPDALKGYRLKLRYKVCYHLGSSCPDVEDVVQETLTRFLCALEENKIRNPESTAAFLSGICNNVIREHWRRTRKEPLLDPDLTLPDCPAPPEADLFSLRQAIALVMNELSERDRDILRAFYLEERDKEEICHSLGLTDSQFRVALFRAKERFRKNYEKTLKQRTQEEH
jgi:RNA polymerase sigma-70 factor (ECF subfamily)